MKSITLLIALTAMFSGNTSSQTPEKDQPPLTKRQADKKKKSDADFIGLTVAQAKKLAKSRDLEFRIAVIDGKRQILDSDCKQSRVNAVVVKGKIAKTSRG